jgi:hypothetical protein
MAQPIKSREVEKIISSLFSDYQHVEQVELS